MFEKFFQKKEQPNDLRSLVFSMPTEDKFLLDEKNAIVVIRNSDEKSNNRYIMIHYRLQDNQLVEINRWYESSYFFGPHNGIYKDFNLFLVKVRGNLAGAIYNYKDGKFLVEKDLWDCIGTNNSVSGIDYHVLGDDYLEKYNGFLAYFSLSSDYGNDDIISYENPITHEKIRYSFNYREGLYFAILNIDGTIRGNKLFKGRNFSRIEEIIDLEQYSSLQEFKTQRKEILNKKKQKEIEEYRKMLEETGKEFVSPYLDEEVCKVLKIGIIKEETNK